MSLCTYCFTHCNDYELSVQNLKIDEVFSKLHGLSREQLTNTRLVCTQFDAFAMLNPNRAMKICISFFFFFFEKVWKNCAVVCCTRHSRGEGYPAIHEGNSKSPCECNKVVTAFWSFCRRSHFVFKFPFFMVFTYPISFINIELLWVQTWTKAWLLRFGEHFYYQ